MTDHTETSTTTGITIQIDPTQVVVGTNVRYDARLDKRLVASVRERGVLVPVVGHTDDEGRFVVLYGQRRTLAAIEAKVDSIPAFVVDSQDDADRLVDQMAENDHRLPLSTGERTRGYKQLAGLGLSAAQIAKRTATKRSEVDAGLAVAKSELATKAVDRWDFLTLEQAAGLAEFDDDVEAVEALAVAAKGGQFDHTLQRLRDARTEAAETLAFAQTLTDAGVTVVDRPSWDDKSWKPLSRLVDAEGSDLTAESHTTCPGHAAYVSRDWEWPEEDGSDAEGTWVCRAVFGCTDHESHGHRDRYGVRGGDGRRVADMADDEREAERSERRDVIESNKAWDSAEKVRREWVKNFLTRKTAPKGSSALIAHAITGDWTTRADVAHHKVPDLAEAFGVSATADQIESAGEGRALVLALGRVLAAYEAQTSRQSWRSVSNHTALYLNFLAANAYSLSPVEARAAGATTAVK